MFDEILKNYGLNVGDFEMKPFGSGLINGTWKLSGAGGQYILQSINKNIFKHPEYIADNLLKLQQYLYQTNPGYLFPAPLPTIEDEHLVVYKGEYYRLFNFVQNSHTVDVLIQSGQAYEAARQFGKFTRLLSEFDAGQLEYTLPGFHNLNLRVLNFKTAVRNAASKRAAIAGDKIKKIEGNMAIAYTYRDLLMGNQIPLRVIHHDTKISNVLFDDQDKGICVIDLDTVMPGYFISDVGDMMRTYLSPANEEERDFSKIQVREDYFDAIYKGYMEEMGDVLTVNEKELFFYSGKYMIYMQAMRFLTDYLNNDIYYGAKYPGHNLVRAQNQLVLLERYAALEPKLNLKPPR